MQRGLGGPAAGAGHLGTPVPLSCHSPVSQACSFSSVLGFFAQGYLINCYSFFGRQSFTAVRAGRQGLATPTPAGCLLTGHRASEPLSQSPDNPVYRCERTKAQGSHPPAMVRLDQ